MPRFDFRDIKRSVAISEALQAVNDNRSAQLGLHQPSEKALIYKEDCERQLVQVCNIGDHN